MAPLPVGQDWLTSWDPLKTRCDEVKGCVTVEVFGSGKCLEVDGRWRGLGFVVVLLGTTNEPPGGKSVVGVSSCAQKNPRCPVEGLRSSHRSS